MFPATLNLCSGVIRKLKQFFCQLLSEFLYHTYARSLNKIQQKTRQKGYLQVQNLDGVFEIDCTAIKSGACLLIDDIIDSVWTVTIIGYLLLQNSVKAVYPYALALNSQKED